MTPEGKVLSKITEGLRKMRLRYIRMALQPFVETGWPDLLILIPDGRALFLEVKAPGKKPTPKQTERISELHALGFNAEWYDDAEAALAFVHHCWRGVN